MSHLPPHPDLDQLRRRARELQRSAAAGDPRARARLASLGLAPTLAAAQLAVARDHGFLSWAALRAEVTRRRSAGRASVPEEGSAPADVRTGSATAGRPTRSWKEMRAQIVRQLEDRTGFDVSQWNRRVADEGLGDERSLRVWLGEQGISGYPQTLLVWERFGYPDFIAADATTLIDAQYRDRAHLRPILDAVLARLPELGDVTVQARKTYISLVSPRRTFAAVQATTRSRVDLGLRLDSPTLTDGRLQMARGVGNGAITVRIALTSVADVDEEAMEWLRRAYAENSGPGKGATAAAHRAP
jgi:hypothetical protein